MDSYLERVLLRQGADPGEERSQSVLKKLNAEIGVSAGKAGQLASAELRREDSGLRRDEAERRIADSELREADAVRQEVYAAEQKRNRELTRMAAQITEALRKERTPGRVYADMKKTEDSSDVIRYGVIPAEVRQEGVQEQRRRAMDALCR